MHKLQQIAEQAMKLAQMPIVPQTKGQKVTIEFYSDEVIKALLNLELAVTAMKTQKCGYNITDRRVYTTCGESLSSMPNDLLCPFCNKAIKVE